MKLTEPLEKAQRGGEFVSEQLKRVLLGEATEEDVRRVEAEVDAQIEAEAGESAPER